MQQAGNIQLVPEASTIFEKVAHFFCHCRVLTPEPEQFMTRIDWPDSDSELSCCERDKQPVSGGYNEAYIVQHWASYQLR